MTIAFIALFAFIVSMHISQRCAHTLLRPLLLLGLFSVFYWQYTEGIGAGDLRMYAVIQFLPMILIPMTILMFPSSNYKQTYIWAVVGIYIAAKLAEYFDAPIYTLLGMSGHNLKHIIAAISGIAFYHAVRSVHNGGGVNSSANPP